MPKSTVTDPQTGRKVTLNGDSPPTEQELEEVFASLSPAPQEAAVAEPAQTAPQEQIDYAEQQRIAEAKKNEYMGSAVAEPLGAVLSGMGSASLGGLAGIGIGGYELARQMLSGEPINKDAAVDRATALSGRIQQAGTFQPRTEYGKEGMRALGGVMQSNWNPLNWGRLANEATGASDKLAESGYPGAATAVSIGADTLAGMGVGKAVKTGFSAANNARNASIVRDATPTAEKLKTEARKIYDEIGSSGAVVNKSNLQSMANDIEAAVRSEGFNGKMHPSVAVTLAELKSAAKKDQPLTQIDTLRKLAGDAAGSLNKSEARLGKIVTNKIDGFLDDLDSSALIGGTIENVGSKYKDARSLWQRAAKSEMISKAIIKADNQASGFENGLRAQFRSILNNEKKSKGLTPEEKAAMETVVKGTTAANTAKLIGKLGFGERQASNMLLGLGGVGAGGVAFGAPGAIAVPAIGQVSRGLAQKLTKDNALLAEQIVRAGKDGTAITRAYLANTPITKRNSAELGELLMKRDADIPQIQTSDKSIRRLLEDSAYLVNAARQEEEQE
jgi:hypothetical protein